MQDTAPPSNMMTTAPASESFGCKKLQDSKLIVGLSLKFHFAATCCRKLALLMLYQMKRICKLCLHIRTLKQANPLLAINCCMTRWSVLDFAFYFECVAGACAFMTGGRRFVTANRLWCCIIAGSTYMS